MEVFREVQHLFSDVKEVAIAGLELHKEGARQKSVDVCTAAKL